jgi:F-type H+-transporting ATPase subunit alpha
MRRVPPQDEVGFVTQAKQYLLTLDGLPSARVNDLLISENGTKAIVRALKDDQITALALEGSARPGDRYSFLGEKHQYSCGEHLFGRIINALGDPVDKKGAFPPGTVPLKLEVDAPGIEVRVPIHEQLRTGITIVDTLIPIAKGQRQLVFGPMRSGKTTFLTETVLAQQREGTVCIYAVIGKPVVGLRKITDTILKEGVASKTIVIAALSDEPAPVIALAPSVAFLIGEYFRDRGEDVLIILDDLDAHAKYLREIGLLEERLPSTESYPGDIFYQHAHLMERSGHFTDVLGGGSITTLPVIQTDFKNFSDLIPTNLMACTDGHLAFLSTLRAEGVYPSISIEQSVTRVGRQAQYKLQKEFTTRTQIALGAYRQQKEYAQFSADLSAQTKEVLRLGSVLEALLEQRAYESIPDDVQVVLVGLAYSAFLSAHDGEFVRAHKHQLLRALIQDAALVPLRTAARTESTPEAFVALINTNAEYLASVCHQ